MTNAHRGGGAPRGEGREDGGIRDGRHVVTKHRARQDGSDGGEHERLVSGRGKVRGFYASREHDSHCKSGELSELFARSFRAFRSCVRQQLLELHTKHWTGTAQH